MQRRKFQMVLTAENQSYYYHSDKKIASGKEDGEKFDPRAAN